MLQDHYLFVYGSLRRDVPASRHHYLNNLTEFIGLAKMPGILYDMGEYPAAIYDTSTQGFVSGELYRSHACEQLFTQLDRYEECSDEFPAPHEYTRQLKTVIQTNGNCLKAWVYLYNRATESLPQIKSGDYLDYLKSTL